MSTYVNALADAGFGIRHVAERGAQRMPSWLAEQLQGADLAEFPLHLLIRADKRKGDTEGRGAEASE